MTREEIAKLYLDKGKVKDIDEGLRLADAYIEKKNPGARVVEPVGPPPAAKPPPRPTNAAQKGDAATPPKGGPKGTVTQKAPGVAREPAVTPSKPSDFMGDGSMLGPERPPRQPAAQLPPAAGSHAADPFPARPRDPTIPERISASTEADVQRRKAEARAAAAGNRAVVNTYVREPVKRVTEFAGNLPGRAVTYATGGAIRGELASETGRGSLTDFIDEPTSAAPKTTITPSFQPSPASARELDRDRERLAAIDIPNAHSMSDARVKALLAEPSVQRRLAE